MWCAHQTAHKPRSTRFAVLNSSASSNPSRCIAIISLSSCMRVGVPGVRMASCGASPADFYGMPTRTMQLHYHFIIVVLLSWNCWRPAPLCCTGQHNGAHQQRQQPLHGTKKENGLGLLTPRQAISVLYTKTNGFIRIFVFQIHITICMLLLNLHQTIKNAKTVMWEST